MDIGALIRHAASRFGPTPAVECEGRVLSFTDFDRATDLLGNALLARGLSPGDRVGVLLPNGVEGLVGYYALAKSGLVRVPLNVKEGPSDHSFKMTDSGCRGLIGPTTDDFAVPTVATVIDTEELERILAPSTSEPCVVDRRPEEPYRLGYTGGTTGKPKAVTLSFRSEHSEVGNFLINLLPDIKPGDRMLHGAPVIHASGAFVLPHLVRGATNVIMTRFDPDRYLEQLEREMTASFLVPTMIAMLLDRPGVDAVTAPALRRFCYGGSSIAPAVMERAINTFGARFAQTYGQAEAPMTITCLQPDEHDRIGSAGRAYDMVEVAIFDPDDRPVPRGEEGEIVTRGQHVMNGYWNRPAETRKVIRKGWVHTGDVGTMDGDGFVYILDRKNDMIISGGYNVYPREVEDIMLRHPAVMEVAVVGLPSDRWGELVHCVVSVRDPTVGVQALIDYAASELPTYKRPRSMQIWDSLPTSPAGKILRRDVRDRSLAAT